MDFCIRLPWINRRRPFIAFHVSPFPGYQIRRGYTREYYHCGIIWGRQFMPTPSGSSFWFDFKFPWRKTLPTKRGGA